MAWRAYDKYKYHYNKEIRNDFGVILRFDSLDDGHSILRSKISVVVGVIGNLFKPTVESLAPGGMAQ